MRKIITFLFALMMTFTMANAQTVVRNGVFSNMYIGINGGVTTGTINSPIATFNAPIDLKALPYNAALEIGKDATPITGFSLEGVCNPDFNTKKINSVEVFGNTKFNLMNLFGGYKGYPRRFEIKTVSGIGWQNFSSNKNDIALQAGLEFDFNLGKERAWYITFSPMVKANEIFKVDEIQYLWTGGPTKDKAAELKANIGVAYRFGSNKTKSHNFVISPYTYTDDQYADLYKKYDECMNRPVEVKVDTVIVEKIVEIEKIVEGDDINGVLNFITFDKGSYKISNTQLEVLNVIMNSMNKNENVKVIGSADTNTGSEKFNTELAVKRADAVRAVLEKNGFNVVETTIKLDAFENDLISRCVIITKK